MTPAPTTTVGEEEIARAICTGAGLDPDGETADNIRGLLDKQPVPMWEHYIDEARAVLALLRQSGDATAGGGVEAPKTEWNAAVMASELGSLVKRARFYREDHVDLHFPLAEQIIAALRRPSHPAGGEVGKLRKRLAEAEEKIGRLQDQVHELSTPTWPEWAERIKAAVREASGYDGSDDHLDGIDLPQEVDDLIREFDHIAEKLTKAEATAREAEAQARRCGEQAERIAKLEAALQRIAYLRPPGDVDTARNSRALLKQIERIALDALAQENLNAR